MSYKGDFALGQTVRGKFSTSAAAGSRIGFSNALEAADIRVYKNDSTTERSSTAGFTVTSDFDSMTGVHHVAIDTSDNTDAGFFAAGNDYDVVAYPDETVDSLNVSAPIFSFSIENRFPFMRTFPALSVGAIPALGIKDRGALASVTSSSVMALRSAAAFGDDTLIGDTLQVEGSTQGYAQSSTITDNANSGDAVTVDALAVTPSGGTYPYIIFAGARAGAALSDIANAVNDDAIARLDGLTSDGTSLVIDGVAYDITRDPTSGYITSITAA